MQPTNPRPPPTGPALPPRSAAPQPVKTVRAPLAVPSQEEARGINTAEHVDRPADPTAMQALGMGPPLPRRLTPNKVEIDLSNSTREEQLAVFEQTRPNAKVLNLSHCKNIFVNFLGFPNLETLDLSFSRIAGMDTHLSELKKLDHLTLSESSFNVINNNGVPENLKTLALKGVRLTEKEIGKIVQMNGLENLSLQNCQVDMSELEALKYSTLKSIVMDGKPIEIKGKFIPFDINAVLKVNELTGTIEIKGKLIEINGKIYLNVD